KRMARRPFYYVQMRWFKHQNSHFSLKTVKKTNTKTMFVCNLKNYVFTKFSDKKALFKKIL
ncbi:TPA: IS5/IS1182 family transposase, partial [Streptococcus suis]